MKVRTDLNYLDLCKEINKLPSDYAIAKKLDVRQPDIAMIRSGSRTIGDLIATKLALSMGIEPMEIIAATNYGKAKTEKSKEFWSRIYRMYKSKNPNTESMADWILENREKENKI